MKNVYTNILLSAVLLLTSIVVQAQANQFRIVDGIPHLPVVTNTTAVTSPITGAMIFSQGNAQVMVYNGAAWYNLANLPAPVGTDSEPYFRVVNNLPCMAVINSGGGWTPTPGLMYYSEFEGEGIMVADGANYHHITNYQSYEENANAMVDADNQNLFAMPVLNTAPIGISAGAFYMNATTEQFEVYNGSAWQTLNTPPQVSNVTISGTLSVGETLSASYTYTDAENDPEGATTFQWYRATSSAGAGATAINGATTQSYIITNNDEGYYMGVKVTPVASSGITPGDAVTNYSSTAVPVPVCSSPTITVTHTAGDVAPVTQTITYQLVETDLGTTDGTKQCWLAQNLGATTQASLATDASDAAAGWCWQFNRKQGYAHSTGGSRTPNTTWDSSREEGPDWEAENDPCTQLLGAGWRIPTQTEWMNVSSNWSNYSIAFSSVLKLHAAGGLSPSYGSLRNRGTSGVYWTSSQISTNGYTLTISYSSSFVEQSWKSDGISVRCLFDL